MKFKYRLYTVTVLALFPLFFLAAGTASAAPQDITITPTSNSPDIKPGAVYKGYFQVVNQGKTAYNFQIYTAPYHVSGENYTPEFTPIKGSANPASWFKFSLSSSRINPGQAAQINYTITMPSATLPGAYFAVAFAQTQFPKVPNSITLNERVGEIFYVRAAGPVTQGGKLLTWQSNFLQEPPVTSTVRLEDSGALNFPATIQVNVGDLFGQTKYSLTTLKQILPQTIRRVVIPWNGAPSLGLFKVTGSVSFLGHTQQLPTKWVLVMSRTVRIYIVAIVAALVVLIALRLLYRLIRKSKKPRHKKQ